MSDVENDEVNRKERQLQSAVAVPFGYHCKKNQIMYNLLLTNRGEACIIYRNLVEAQPTRVPAPEGRGNVGTGKGEVAEIRFSFRKKWVGLRQNMPQTVTNLWSAIKVFSLVTF